MQGTRAAVGIDPDEQVRCSFRLKLLTSKAGRWRVRDGTGRLTCGGESSSIPPDTNFARLKVRDGGDRIISRDTSGRRRAVTLDRDPGDLLTYAVQTTVRGPGGSGKATVTFNVIDEERIDGLSVIKTRAGGKRCTIHRPFTSKWVGE